VVEREFPVTWTRLPTEAQRGAQARLVPPVFQLAPLAGQGARDDLNVFPSSWCARSARAASKQRCYACRQAGFPDRISRTKPFRPSCPPEAFAHHPHGAGAPRVHPFVGPVVDMIAHTDEASVAGSIELRQMEMEAALEMIR